MFTYIIIMKNILYFILVFLLISCELTGIKLNCDEEMELTQQELTWGQEQDSILYISSTGDTIFTYLEQVLYAGLGNYCPKPANKQIYYKVNSSDKIFLVNYFISKTEQYGSKISFQFNSSNVNSDVPVIGISQSMGSIDIETNEPRDIREVDYAQTTKLGTHELNGEIYNNVFLIEDLKKSEVPEIDIFRFYVNPSGILRIEFYDGEVWDRID